jgi:hypothetical protein
MDPNKIRFSRRADGAAQSVMRQFIIGIQICFCLNAEIGKGVENSKSVQEPQNHDNNHDNIQNPFD